VRPFGLILWLIACAAQPAWAQAPEAPGSLEQQLAATASDNPGEYGIAAMDLSTGASVAFHGDEAFPMASTVKIAIAATYLSQVDAGRRSLDDTTAAGQSAAKLMDLMITRSDNRATDLLLGMLGGPGAVDSWLRSNNLTGIRVDRTIAQLLGDRRDLHDVRDSSTPAAMLGLLRLIDAGPSLTPSSRALLLDMMARCVTGTNRIKGILPPGARVEHKTGTLNGYTGDVGFLTTPAGKRIALVIFARGGENRPGVIATIAREIYEGFTQAPVQPMGTR